MKIVLTGSRGQVGASLHRLLADHEVHLLDRPHWTLDGPDCGTPIRDLAPDWVIHTAAWTAVDACAESPELARRRNGEAVAEIAAACKSTGSRLLHVSTNEVFPGEANTTYHETSTPNPINPYGAAKHVAEEAIQSSGAEAIIVRTAWVFSQTHANFATRILALARERPSLQVVADEFGNPTYAPDLAIALRDLLLSDARGIFHLVNEGVASRLSWTQCLLDCAGLDTPLHPISQSEFPRASTPPKHAVLTNTRAKEQGIFLPRWEDACGRFCTG